MFSMQRMANNGDRWQAPISMGCLSNSQMAASLPATTRIQGNTLMIIWSLLACSVVPVFFPWLLYKQEIPKQDANQWMTQMQSSTQ